MVYGTYGALRSIMFERSCLLPNIKALCINSLPVIAEENAQQPRLFLRTFLFTKIYARKDMINVLFTKIYARKDMINAYLQILLLNFSPQ